MNKTELTMTETKRSLTSAAWLSVLATTLMTCLHASIAGRAGLTVDGAHYALYGVHLALSYYDHPPLVGWLQALALPWGHSDFTMRIIPMGIGWLWPLLLYQLSKRCFPEAHPWQHAGTVLLALSAVLINLMSLAFIPQLPLLLFAIAALLCLHQAVQTEQAYYWLGFGVLLGLAGLAEYTAICLAFAAILYTVTSKPKLLKQAAPWAAVLIALLVISPVLIWNAQHDWVSIKFQLAHGNHHPDWRLSRFLLSQLTQVISYSPGFILITLCGIGAGLRRLQHSGTRLLLCVSLPTLLLFAYESGFERTLPHWPALAWIMACPLGSRFLCLHWQRLLTKAFTALSALLALTMILVVHAEIFHPFLPFPNYQNPLKDLYGWKPAATKANRLLTQLKMQSHNHSLKLFVPNWTLGSRLAWYSGQAVQIASPRTGVDQFSIWYGQPQTGDSGLLVVPHGWGNPPATGQVGQFQTCELIAKLPFELNHRLVNQFHYYYCKQFKRHRD